MRYIFAATCIGILAGAAPLAAQNRPAADATRGAARDTVAADTARALRLRIRGDLLSSLPLDDAERVLEFFPGFMRATSGAVVYRTDIAALGMYVDGVPVRTLIGDRRAMLPSLNALESVSLTTGAPAATRGSGVVEYMTIAAGDAWAGDARVLSDIAAPGSWNQHRTRIDLGASGPIPGVSGLRFAVAGQLIGQKYSQLPGSDAATVYVASGVDTTITLAGATGPVDVVVPEYVPWSYDELPFGNSDRSDVTSSLTYGSGAAEYGLRFHRTGVQDVSRSLHRLYNADAWLGTENTAQMVSLFARRPLPLGLTGDIVVSHQSFDATSGILDPRWANLNSHPSFGINAGSLGFLAERADYPVTDPLLIGLRSGVLPWNALTFTTIDSNLLPLRQGVRGINEQLRLNPYAMRDGLPISGVGSGGEAAVSWATERRWYGRAAITRASGVHSVQIGGEVDRTKVESLTLRLAEGLPFAFREKPALSAAFAHAATSLQGIRIDAGVRVEHQSSDAAMPRVPGFVTNVPDSLRGDAYILRPGSEPWQERLQPVIDCGGTTTVCKDNFVPVASHTTWSPRVSASYAGPGRFSARASFGSYVQMQSLRGAAFTDLTATNTNFMFLRDTDPVRENVAEMGVRVRTADASWVDLQLFRLNVTNPIVQRGNQYTNPVSGSPLILIVPVNDPSRVTTGLELSTLQRVGTWAGFLGSLAVSHTNGIDDVAAPSDPVRAAGIVWLDLGEIGGPASVARALDDLTLHMTASWSQGGRYTRFENIGNGYLSGRLNSVITSGTLAERPLSSRLPSRTEMDLRIAKGFRIGGTTARLVADLRNPLGFENVHTVFAETGTTENEEYQHLLTAEAVLNYSLAIGMDRVIDEWPENDVNRYMLRRAEQRFGNGDGTFTTSEMTAAVSSYLGLMGGRQWLVDSDRELRLGVEVSF